MSKNTYKIYKTILVSNIYTIKLGFKVNDHRESFPARPCGDTKNSFTTLDAPVSVVTLFFSNDWNSLCMLNIILII